TGVVPPADGNTSYHLILPATTQVLAGQIYGLPTPSCTPSMLETYSSAGDPAPFSYVPRCGGATIGLSDLDFVTARGTEAMIDTLVNPFPWDRPAYAEASWRGSGWALLTSSAPAGYPVIGLGEMCHGTRSDATSQPADIGFVVPRIWSNGAAAS